MVYAVQAVFLDISVYLNCFTDIVSEWKIHVPAPR